VISDCLALATQQPKRTTYILYVDLYKYIHKYIYEYATRRTAGMPHCVACCALIVQRKCCGGIKINKCISFPLGAPAAAVYRQAWFKSLTSFVAYLIVPQMRGSLNCILHTAYRCKSSLINNVGSKYPKSVLHLFAGKKSIQIYTSFNQEEVQAAVCRISSTTSS